MGDINRCPKCELKYINGACPMCGMLKFTPGYKVHLLIAHKGLTEQVESLQSENSKLKQQVREYEGLIRVVRKELKFEFYLNDKWSGVYPERIVGVISSVLTKYRTEGKEDGKQQAK